MKMNRTVKQIMSLILVFSMLLGIMPEVFFIKASADMPIKGYASTGKWKILQISSGSKGLVFSTMNTENYAIEMGRFRTNPTIDDYIINVSMSSTQRFDFKLYRLKSGLTHMDVSSKNMSYATGISSVPTVIPELDSLSTTTYEYLGSDSDDPRGELVGYLKLNGSKAENVVLRGMTGNLTVNDCCTIAGGVDYSGSGYRTLNAAATTAQRQALYDEQRDGGNFIILDETQSGGENGVLNRILWDGSVVDNSGADVTLPDSGIDYYILSVEPRGVDIYREVVREEYSGEDDENGDPIMKDVSYYYPGGTASPSGSYSFNKAKGYVSMSYIEFDYEATPDQLGEDPLQNDDEEECSGGDPINLLTGNFTWQYTDLEVNSKTPVTFMRYYNSLEDYNGDDSNIGVLGYGWRHSYEYTLELGAYSATVTLANGYALHFAASLTEEGVYERWDDNRYKLEGAGNTYTLYASDGMEYVFTNEKLTSIKRAGVSQYTFTYSGDKLSQIFSKQIGAYFTLSYDGNGRIETVTDNSGRIVTYKYDTNDNLIESINPDGDSLHFIYEDAQDEHNITKMLDYEGDVYLENIYDSKDRVVSQYMPARGTCTISYDVPNMVNTYTDFNGKKTRYYYDQSHKLTKKEDDNGDIKQEFYKGNLMQKEDALGNITKYTYDSNDRLLTVTYPDGSSVSNTYDSETGLIKRRTYQDNTYIEYVYDTRGNITSARDRRGNTASYEYDSSDNLKKITDREGKVTEYTYDAMGNPLTVKDAENNITTYGYDALGRLTSVTSPEGVKEEYEYSPAGKLIKIKDDDGNSTELDVNSNGYATGSTDPLGHDSNAVYDNTGNLLSYTDAERNFSSYEYDEIGNLIKYTDPLGHQTSYAYDKNGNMISVTDRRGNKTSMDYDELNRPVSTTDALNNASGVVYDNMGRVSVSTDAKSAGTDYEYDITGRVTKETDVLGNSISREYDSNGNLTKLTDKNGNSITYQYDKEDRLKTVTNALNESITYVYDATGRLTQTKDHQNNTQTTGYDRDGNMTSMKTSLTPAAQVTQYQYDSLGRLSKEILPDGVTEVTYKYDKNGRLEEKSNIGGGFTSYEYNSNGQMTKSIDPKGAETVMTYTARGELESVTDALGGITSYIYDPEGNVLSSKDAAGHITSYTYDPLNRVKTMNDGNGSITTYVYDAISNIQEIHNPDGGVITYAYDLLGRVTSIADGEGMSTAYEYDPNGNVTVVTDPLGNKTEYAYDALNRKTSVVNADSKTYSIHYNSIGQTDWVIDEENVKTAYEYDTAGRLTTITNGLNKKNSYEYDIMDRVISETDENGVARAFVYDNAGNITRYTDGNGNIFEFVYDEIGRLLTEKAPSNIPGNWIITSYTYDSLGRVKAKTNNENHKIDFTYDKLGRIISVGEYQDTTRNLYTVTSYKYDGNGNVIETTDGNGRVTKLEYDSMNRLVKVINAGTSQQVTLYKYDKRGLVTEVVSGFGTALSASKNLQYDDAGNLILQTDADGNVISYDYDSLNRITGMNSTKDAVSYVYNATGQLIEMTDANGVTSFVYDALQRLTEVSDHNGRTTAYTYDGIGNITDIIYPDSTSVKYLYDDENRLTSVTAFGETTTYGYNRAGNLEKVLYATGEERWYTFNTLGQLTQLVEKQSSITRRRYDYSYDDSGNIVSETRIGIGYNPKTEVSTFSYDLAGQLVQKSEMDVGTTTYKYDAFGNLTDETLSLAGKTQGSSTYTYNERSQLTKKVANGVTSVYTYDKRGNLTGENTAGKISAYEYDASGRLVKGTNAGGDTSEYVYNGLGMRVANIQTIKAENRANNVYKSPSNSYGSYYIGSLDDLALENRSDTGQEVYVDNFGLTRQNDVQTIMYSYMPDYAGGAERDLMRWQEGQHKTAYVYGLSGLVAQKTSHIIGEVHPLTGATIDTSGSHKNIYSDIAVEIGILYHHENRLGSSDYITDANGGIRAWSAYDEWGLPSYGTSYNMNTAGIISSASFTGYDWDNVLGVYFAQFRFYDPANKRFMSEDPIRSGRNWYAYCDNNPVMWVDPWGLEVAKVTINGVTKTIDTSNINSVFKMVQMIDPSADISLLNSITAYNYETKKRENVKFEKDMQIISVFNRMGVYNLMNTSLSAKAIDNYYSIIQCPETKAISYDAQTQDALSHKLGTAPSEISLTDVDRQFISLLMEMEMSEKEALNYAYLIGYTDNFDETHKEVYGSGVFALLPMWHTFIENGITYGEAELQFNQQLANERDAATGFGAAKVAVAAIKPATVSGSQTTGSTGKTASTGRTSPNNLNEQLAMEQVQSNPMSGATKVPTTMSDPRWSSADGWVKMQNIVQTSGGKINIHFNYNTKTGAVADFKFVN